MDMTDIGAVSGGSDESIYISSSYFSNFVQCIYKSVCKM
jgi:hypothetical protein